MFHVEHAPFCPRYPMKSQIGIIYSAPMIMARKAGRKSQTRRLVRITKTYEQDYGKPVLDKGWIDTSYLIKARGNVPCLKIPFDGNGQEDMQTTHRHFPDWEPGDLLWARETYTVTAWKRLSSKFRGLVRLTGFYNADNQKFQLFLTVAESEKFVRRKRKLGKIPAIFMFRSLSRFTDVVTQVRAQRVQGITNRDAWSEGLSKCPSRFNGVLVSERDPSRGAKGLAFAAGFAGSPKYVFSKVWESIHNPHGYCVDDAPNSWAANPWVWVIEFQPAAQPKKRTKRWLDRRFGARR